MERAGPWVLAASVVGAVAFALWSGPGTVPDPIGRGSAAPDFALSRLPGAGEIRLSSLRGRVVLLNFWATWCKPCEDEMPAMERLYQALASQGLELLAVSVDEAPDGVVAFGQRLGLSFPLLWDSERKVADAYQAYRFPETLLIDRDGVVVERYIGPKQWDSPLYEARLRRLLAHAGSR